MKSTETLVEDIYNLMKTKQTPEGVDLEVEIEKFGELCKDLMRGEFNREPREPRRLRLSAIGKPDKQLWQAYHAEEQEVFEGPTLIKFMYGHLIEEMLLFFTRASGHIVTDEQHETQVEGVKGHIDCRIDGVLLDVKSASSFGMKKFKEGTLCFDDPFGYVDQIKAYAHEQQDEVFGWLAMDKTTGNLALLEYDMNNPMSDEHKEALDYDISERVRYVKELVAGPEPIELCHQPIPEGKSGNMKLPTGCSYCRFKHNCHPNLQTYYYASGPKYLTTVAKEPRVTQEIPSEF
jgi:hypothetical protein